MLKNNCERSLIFKNDMTSIKLNDISYYDVEKLNKIMKVELSYYNYIIEFFNKLLKTNPMSITEFANKDLINILNICLMYNILPTNDHKSLNQYRDIINNISDNANKIFEVINIITSLNIKMKINIINQILSYYIEEAKKRISKHKIKDGFEFSMPLQSLVTYNFMQKHHFQLQKKLMNIKWDSENCISFIKLPYFNLELSVNNYDLSKENKWNIAIIHQHGMKPNSPWFLTLSSRNKFYDIYFIDNPKWTSNVEKTLFNKSVNEYKYKKPF